MTQESTLLTLAVKLANIEPTDELFNRAAKEKKAESTQVATSMAEGLSEYLLRKDHEYKHGLNDEGADFDYSETLYF